MCSKMCSASLYSPEIPAAVAPTKTNVVKVMNTVLDDTEVQQKQKESINDPLSICCAHIRTKN